MDRSCRRSTGHDKKSGQGPTISELAAGPVAQLVPLAAGHHSARCDRASRRGRAAVDSQGEIHSRAGDAWLNIWDAPRSSSGVFRRPVWQWPIPATATMLRGRLTSSPLRNGIMRSSLRSLRSNRPAPVPFGWSLVAPTTARRLQPSMLRLARNPRLTCPEQWKSRSTAESRARLGARRVNARSLIVRWGPAPVQPFSRAAPPRSRRCRFSPFPSSHRKRALLHRRQPQARRSARAA